MTQRGSRGEGDRTSRGSVTARNLSSRDEEASPWGRRAETPASLSRGDPTCKTRVRVRGDLCYDLVVPIISSFFGIIIRMFFDDHAPPHFHAEFQGQEALVDFSGAIIEGEISSSRARKLIREWAKLHRSELELNWRRAKKLQPLANIAPLD